MDGLAGGVAAVASFFFTLLAILDGQVLIAILGAAMLGACLGFLRWNFTPAKIFMGDGGAMFLGFMMATLGLKLNLTNLGVTAQCMIPVLVLAVPVFDTTLVSISRARRGLIPFTSPGKDHSAHRLANVGLRQRDAVLVLYAAGTVGGVLALLARRFPIHTPLVPAAVAACVVAAAVSAFERLPYERQKAAGSPSQPSL
jgi:UDP-GlcNAc:undecaprenyl-phosphate GlcNAc-1-phosphate transferase